MDIFVTKAVFNMDAFRYMSCIFVLCNFLSTSHENPKEEFVEVAYI